MAFHWKDWKRISAKSSIIFPWQLHWSRDWSELCCTPFFNPGFLASAVVPNLVKFLFWSVTLPECKDLQCHEGGILGKSPCSSLSWVIFIDIQFMTNARRWSPEISVCLVCTWHPNSSQVTRQTLCVSYYFVLESHLRISHLLPAMFGQTKGDICLCKSMCSTV